MSNIHMVRNKRKKNKRERKVEKELLLIVGFLIVLVLVFAISGAIFRSFNSFEYEGLTFTKESFGEIPVFHYYYYFIKNAKITKYNLYVRNDPRTNDIPIVGKKIIFDNLNKKDFIYISINSVDLQECNQGVLAVADLTRFLDDNSFNVEGANLDFWEAGRKRQEWVTCNNKPGNLVLELDVGDETGIFISNKCHRIKVSNCEILEAVEKYKIQAVIDAR